MKVISEEMRNNIPEWATHWRDMDSWCSPNEILYYCCVFGIWLVWDVEKLSWKRSIIHDGDDYILEQLKPL